MKTLFKTTFIAAAAALTVGCSQIDTGNVGVESTLGQVKQEMLAPGVHFTLFKRITEVMGKEAPIALNDLKPQTSDKITLQDLDVDIYVQVNPKSAPQIMTKWQSDVTYVDGEDSARLGHNYIARQAREVIYSAIAQQPSATVHMNRAEISEYIVKNLQESIDREAGKDLFYIRSANVRNLTTDPALEENIKAAAQAQFKLQEERNRLEVARVEAERKREEARGEADAMKIKAEAVSANGGAQYVELKAIEKWDGKLPANTAGVIPFINLK